MLVIDIVSLVVNISSVHILWCSVVLLIDIVLSVVNIIGVHIYKSG